MKYLQIFLLLSIMLAFSSCFKDKKDEPVFGSVLGTFYNDDGIYVISDTIKGVNGAEIRYYFENDDTLKEVKNLSRIFFTYLLVKENETSNFLVKCTDYDTIPIKKIIYVKEEDNDIRDGFGKFPTELKYLSISHDFLNIATEINYKDKSKHFFEISKDEHDQNQDIKNEITLNFYHKDEENLDYYYEKGLFFISVPIKELQSLWTECDTISIRVHAITELADFSLRINYANPDAIKPEE